MVHFETFSKEWKRVLRDPQDDLYEQIILRHELKDFRRNVAWRRWVLEEGERDVEFGRRLWAACSRDLLFFANTFAWFEEPRKGVGIDTVDPIFPFISWPVQDWSLTRMHERLGEKNIMFIKPRGLSFSWQVILLYFYATTFEFDRKFGVSSYNETKVDSQADSSTILGKIDILAKYMPSFLLPKEDVDRGKLYYRNRATNSSVHGYPTTKNVDRGGRKYSSFGDELAEVDRSKDRRMITSLRGVSNSLILGSTLGERRTCEFNRLAFDASYPALRLRADCWDIPAVGRGRYTTGPDGSVKILDEDNPPPADYPFILDGTVRSPVFDEKTRGMSKEEIAREFLVDVEGATAPTIDPDTVKRLRSEQAEPPKFRFTVKVDKAQRKLVLRRDAHGPLAIFYDAPDGVPPADDAYAIAADPSHGQGRNPSTFCILSRSTGRQMAEFASASVDAARLAVLAWAAGKLFAGVEREALLNFDAQGPTGSAFRKRVVGLGYRHFWKRPKGETEREEETDRIGFGARFGFGDVLCELLDAADRGDARIVSEDCWDEFSDYVLVDGRYVHDKAASGEDVASSENTHGDRVCAAALAWLCVERKPYRPEKKIVRPRLDEDGDEFKRLCDELLEEKFAAQFTAPTEDPFDCYAS